MRVPLFASILVVGLCFCAAFAQADVLVLKSGEEIQGQLTDLANKSFVFGEQKGKGIFIAKHYLPEQVASIVVSSSEDALFMKYQELSNNEVIAGTTIEVVNRPVDALVLLNGIERDGRLKEFRNGALLMNVAVVGEPERVEEISANDVKSMSLSNADRDLELKVANLDSLVQTRTAHKEIAEKQAQDTANINRLDAELQSSLIKQTGSIYDPPASAGANIEPETTTLGKGKGETDRNRAIDSQRGQTPNSYDDGSRKANRDFGNKTLRDKKESEQGTVQDSQPSDSQNTNTGRTDRDTNSRQRDRRDPGDRRDRSDSSSLKAPLIKSMEVTGQGPNQKVIYHY